jgi:hypothetical protein
MGLRDAVLSAAVLARAEDFAVDRGAADGEQFGEISDRVLACVIELQDVRTLPGGSL